MPTPGLLDLSALSTAVSPAKTFGTTPLSTSVVKKHARLNAM
jgi:hypothetical protein